MINKASRVLVTALLAVPSLSAFAAVLDQPAGSDHFPVQAEAVDSVLNPDAANDVQNSVQTGSAESPIRVWSVVTVAGALGGQAIQGPPSPHKQTTTTSLQESVAVFKLRFAKAGSYKLYTRAMNNGTAGNGGSDSIWAPGAFGTGDPTVNVSVSDTGSFGWEPASSETFTVSAAQVGQELELRYGVRENSAHIDAFVLSLTTNLSSTQLDQIMNGGATLTPTPTATATPSPTPVPTPTGPTPTPVPGAVYVSNVSQFDAAVAAANPGARIIMRAGIWNNVSLLFEGSKTVNDTGGTAAQPIRLEAERGGEVVITGTSMLRITGNFMQVDGLKFQGVTTTGGQTIAEFKNGSRYAFDCSLTNTAFYDCNPQDTSTDYDWVGIFGERNRVDHCWMTGMNHPGVQLVIWPTLGGKPAEHYIGYNYFGDRAFATGNGFETIRIGTSDVSSQYVNTTVERNYFYRCDGEIETISNKTWGNKYLGNTFVECKGQLTLRHGGGCLVDGNYFLQSNSSTEYGGVRIIGTDHVVINNYFQNIGGTQLRAATAFMNGVPGSPLNRYIPIERALVAFNTYVNCREVFAIGTESSEGDTTVVPKDSIIANNAVFMNSGQACFRLYNAPQNFTYEGNLYQGGSFGMTATAGWTSTTLQIAQDGTIYRPATSSPMINGAVGSYPTVTTDMEGQPRNDGQKDVGSDEKSTAPVTRGPLTPEMVGPNWLHPQVVALGDGWML